MMMGVEMYHFDSDHEESISSISLRDSEAKANRSNIRWNGI